MEIVMADNGNMDRLLSLFAEGTKKDYNIRNILLEFLEVLDSIDRLVVLSEKNSDKTWHHHLKTLQQQFIKALNNAGISFFNSYGQPFDPQRHEAVEVIELSNIEDSIIIEEIARGCTWQGEIFRFARVIVAKNNITKEK